MFHFSSHATWFLEKELSTHSNILAWEFCGQESLVGYSLRGCKELDMTKWLTHTHTHTQSIFIYSFGCVGFPGGSDGKASACNVGDPGLIHGSGRSPGEGNGNPSRTLTWKIPWMEELDTVHVVPVVTKSQTQLSNFTFTWFLVFILSYIHFHFYFLWSFRNVLNRKFKGEGIDWEFGIDMYTLQYLKQINKKEMLQKKKKVEFSFLSQENLQLCKCP